MLEVERSAAIFADAWTLYEDAIEQLDQGKLRNAAEKAWGATKRATDAFILARTGDEPRTAGRTMRAFRAMRRDDPELESLLVRYGFRAHVLHGMCFYDGICEPEDETARNIRETADYIRDAEVLAGEGN